MKYLSKTQLSVGLAWVAGAALVVGAGSCSYKQSRLDTPTPCNLPATVSYQTHVWPILKANCRDACHNDQSAASYYNFSMDQFSQVQYYCTHTPPGVSGTTPWLLGNVQHLGNGYANMPVGGAKLSDCDIAVLEAWIKAGALNN